MRPIVIKLENPTRHGSQKVDAALSNYYVVEEVQSNFRGMEVAISSQEWESFAQMTIPEFVKTLLIWAQKVNLKRFLSSPRGIKKPVKKLNNTPKCPHVATFRILNPD